MGDEVHDDVVIPVADSFNPADEAIADDTCCCFFPDFTFDRLAKRFAKLDVPAGHRPLPLSRASASLYEQ